MICSSCGANIDGQGKFCANCGARVPEAAPAPAQPAAPPPPPAPPAAPPPAPAWAAAPPPPPVAAPPAQPAWGQAPPPPPAQPAWGQAPPPYAAQQYGTPGYAAPPRPAAAGGSPLPALILIAGAAAALGSLALPWVASSGGGSMLMPLEATSDMSTLANGYYLLGGGIAIAVAGAALLLKVMPGMAKLLALVAIIGGGVVIGVEVTAYDHVSKVISVFGSGVTVGPGLYLGAAGGAAGVLGGIIRLVTK